MTAYMSFDEWRKTRRFTPDLAKTLDLHPDDLSGDVAGFVYDGGTWLGLVDSDRSYVTSTYAGTFSLLIGNTQKQSFDLDDLERKLYKFWASEVASPNVFAVLGEEYDAFLARTGLPKLSADELYAEVVGTTRCSQEDQQWLLNFSERWEAAS